MTRQKQLILRILRKTRTHPTAHAVFLEARQEMPSISLGTVYRNLHQLREAGDIRELDYSRWPNRFDGNPAEHHHFVCLECRRVVDLDLPVDRRLIRAVEEEIGGTVGWQRTEFCGWCETCHRDRAKGIVSSDSGKTRTDFTPSSSLGAHLSSEGGSK